MTKPPDGMASRKPSSWRRTSAIRIGVRDMPSRSTIESSEMRSPGLSPLARINSRSASWAFTVCEDARSVSATTDASTLGAIVYRYAMGVDIEGGISPKIGTGHRKTGHLLALPAEDMYTGVRSRRGHTTDGGGTFNRLRGRPHQVAGVQ